MVGKKSIYSSPVFKRGKVLSIPCSGQLFFEVDYFNDEDSSYFFKANRDYYVKNKLNQGGSVSVTNGQVDFLVEPKKITKLFLKSDGLDFDSSVLNRLSSLRSLNIKSPNSVFRLNDIPYGCSSFVFEDGELKNGYTSRKFSNVIDTVDLRNEKGIGLTSSEVNQVITDLNNTTFIGNKLIRILGNNSPRTSDVDSIVSSLRSRGVTVDTYYDADDATLYNLLFNADVGLPDDYVCESVLNRSVYQYSDFFNFTKPIYSDASAQNLAPLGWYSDSIGYRYWNGSEWGTGGATLCNFSF